jgi:hypothetical protein
MEVEVTGVRAQGQKERRRSEGQFGVDTIDMLVHFVCFGIRVGAAAPAAKAGAAAN